MPPFHPAATAPTNTPAPAAGAFPAFPVSWYFCGSLAELEQGPVSKEIFGQRLVAFRNERGVVRVMDARCSHFGTDLGKGCMVG